ncbi:non-homologous end-joining DNA ligase [Opitutus terrae]|uniref:DNA ligase (ATP) n=1 Tax=Opitutus terrae (strain DSM 11246 / JCM 15787 / PB90-1) TaxID=452637 RepID=B1ZP92_OPITP|nr:non-homologous end-joining DNA ligase [Opitutus terrae]ACB77581.1 DNA polymerase LigD, ligase domain protein [Opitutus terrae PB90-1]
MSLKAYVKKRDFRKTAEPKGGRAPGGAGHRFVVQKHAASRLHYDFRLELGGTLKSWAVPKGMPYAKGDKRLAVHVEDHPVSYIDFEGTIPQGQYGGGTVMVWDRGTFEPLSEAPLKELDGGKLHFVLRGKKLKGEWYLVRLRGGDEWLLIKGGEDMKPVSAKADDTSVLSGKSMKQLSEGKGRVWQSNRSEPKSFRASVAEAMHAAETKRRTKKETFANLEPRRPRRGRQASDAKASRDEGVAAPAKAAHGRAADKSAGVKAEHGSERARRPRAQGRASKLTPSFIEPMKALLVDAPPPGEWIYEIKFDGFRAMAFRDRKGVRLLSRNNKPFAAKFPEIVDAVAALDVKDAVIDGEIVALDDKGRSSFQLLQAYDLGQEHPPLFFYAFDLLQWNGRDLRAEPLTERKAQLERLLAGHDGLVRYSKSLGADAEPLLAQARKLGLEGLIGKRPDARYETGQRSGAWIKLKLHQEQEFVIGGYSPPGGSRPYFGALLVGVHEGAGLTFAGKVGTGFNVKLLRELHGRFQKIRTEACPFVNLPEKRRGRYGAGVTAAEMKRCTWVKPELVAQIKFAEWTRDDRLRQPVFLGLREDKPAREVVRERSD